MKKTIALFGKAEVGKTATLNLLIDLLEVATTGCDMPKPMPPRQDRKKAFYYKEMKIGIGTRGDNQDEIEINCSFFDIENCDVVFTATRTKGGSCNAIRKYCSEKGFELIWVKKECIKVENAIDSYNLNLAQQLLNRI